MKALGFMAESYADIHPGECLPYIQLYVIPKYTDTSQFTLLRTLYAKLMQVYKTAFS